MRTDASMVYDILIRVWPLVAGGLELGHYAVNMELAPRIFAWDESYRCGTDGITAPVALAGTREE